MGYLTGQQAQQDISQYLMSHFNWIRPHQFNDGNQYHSICDTRFECGPYE